MELVSFSKVIKNYKVVFFDAYGVLKNYNGIIPGIDKTFEHLVSQKKEYFVITNDASRSPEQARSAQ